MRPLNLSLFQQQLRKVDSGDCVCRSDADGPFIIFPRPCNSPSEKLRQSMLQTREHAQWSSSMIGSIQRDRFLQRSLCLESMQGGCCFGLETGKQSEIHAQPKMSFHL